MPARRDFVAGPDDGGRRLDRVLRIFLKDLPLSVIYKALRQKRILLNGAKAGPSHLVSSGDVIAVEMSLLGKVTIGPGGARENIASGSRDVQAPLAALTLFECPDLLFVNKPRGMSTHGKDGLDLLVRESLRRKCEASLSFMPAPLHRLDRNTSGIVAVSSSIEGARAFTAALRSGLVRKSYLALVDGLLLTEERWEDLLERDETSLTSTVSEDGDLALATALPLLRSARRSLVLVGLETGRTHQIRAQAAHHGHPLSGDSKYGGSTLAGGYILHAWRMEFGSAIIPGLPGKVRAPLPLPALRVLEMEFGREDVERALERD